MTDFKFVYHNNNKYARIWYLQNHFIYFKLNKSPKTQYSVWLEFCYTSCKRLKYQTVRSWSEWLFLPTKRITTWNVLTVKNLTKSLSFFGYSHIKVRNTRDTRRYFHLLYFFCREYSEFTWLENWRKSYIIEKVLHLP